MHFDTLSPIYDSGKTKNSYYYLKLKQSLRKYIPTGCKVLEIGCGTGEILMDLKPEKGVGIDISTKMRQQCQHKYPQGTWVHSDIVQFTKRTREEFDVIVIADTVEHVADLPALFACLPKVSHANTRIVISMINPPWTYPLILAEQLKLKLPEGPHKRYSFRYIHSLLSAQGLKLTAREFSLLLPKKIPLLTPLAGMLERAPLIRRLCFLELLVYEYRSE